jgi:hypothetical protein
MEYASTVVTVMGKLETRGRASPDLSVYGDYGILSSKTMPRKLAQSHIIPPLIGEIW